MINLDKITSVEPSSLVSVKDIIRDGNGCIKSFKLYSTLTSRLYFSLTGEIKNESKTNAGHKK